MESVMLEQGKNLKVSKKRKSTSDRLTLTKSLQEKADQWLNQVNEHFKGMVVLKRYEILTTLLENVPNELPPLILDKIQQEKLTDVQKAKWIYEQLKNAEKEGQELNLESLLKVANNGAKRKNKSRKRDFKATEKAAKAIPQTPSDNFEKVSNNNRLK